MLFDTTKIVGFEWDEGNQRKSTDKHGVSQTETEQVFVNRPLLLLDDAKHSDDERRFHAYGTTHGERLLQVSFTLRREGTLIRIISARPMSAGSAHAMPKKRKATTKRKTVPSFRNEADERAFWESHDTADYFDLTKARRANFPNLKLSTTSISLRLPTGLLDQIKIAANKRDVPYQSLIKMWLAEKVG